MTLVVGTHAIFQKEVSLHGWLVITDEQHRFGVAQRTLLADKGGCPHKLVMSATPIPRTLALMIYGDLDISVLKELPRGRLPVQTFAVTGKLRQRAYSFIRQQLEQGHQGYIVCPMIDDRDESELQAVSSYAESIQAGAFSAYRVGLLHGRMKPAEKDSVMTAFRNHELDLLVSTTVIEVGVDVPNATILLIENAERFGLSQLHQLRGRVGRGSAQSYCILMTDHVTEDCRTRMQIMSVPTTDFRSRRRIYSCGGRGTFSGSGSTVCRRYRSPTCLMTPSCSMKCRKRQKKFWKKMRICRLPNMGRCGWKYCVCSAAAAKMAEIRRFSCAYHTIGQC